MEVFALTNITQAIDISYCAVALAIFCAPSAQRERWCLGFLLLGYADKSQVIWTLQVLAISTIMWTKAIQVLFVTMAPEKPKWPALVSFFVSTVHYIGMIALYTYAEVDPVRSLYPILTLTLTCDAGLLSPRKEGCCWNTPPLRIHCMDS